VKKLLPFLAGLFFVFILASANADKVVSLKINDSEADVLNDSVVVQGPGTFTLQGKIVNNMAIESSEKNLDLVFILDASGSMQPEINSVKNSIKKIINEINADAPGRMRVGIYVLEGWGSNKEGFTKKPSYCEGSNDVGAIYLSSDAQNLKKRLGQVKASCGREPWAYLTYNVLNDNSFGWRNDAVRVVIAISDEPSNGCGSSNCSGCTKAINTINSQGAFFFGIYHETAKANMQTMDAATPGDVYLYTNPSQIPSRIKDAINYVLSNDDFTVTREQGENWDDLGANFEIKNVAREGGTATFTINLTTPPTYTKPFVYFQYRLKLKGSTTIYDDAWLKVLMSQPPVAHINALTPAQGDATLVVEMNAEGTTDPDGIDTLDRFEWDCESDGVTDFTTHALTDSVSCSYPEKNKTYTVTMTAVDKAGVSGSATLTVKTNPNKEPLLSLDINPPSSFPTEDVTFTANASDPDGSVVLYEWDFGDGHTESCPACSQFVHQYASKGNKVVSVTVTDNDGDTNNVVKSVIISNRPPHKPVVSAKPSKGFTPLTVNFTADAVDPDGDSISAWDWDYGDGSPIKTTDCGVDPNCNKSTHVFATDSNFHAKVRAMDSDGAWSEWSDSMVESVTVYAISVLDVNNTLVGGDINVVAECTDPGLVVDINILDSDGNSVYGFKTQCHGLKVTPPLPANTFTESGAYRAIASIEGHACSNCPKTAVFLVRPPNPRIRSPETSMPAVLGAVLAVMLIARKREKNQPLSRLKTDSPH